MPAFSLQEQIRMRRLTDRSVGRRRKRLPRQSVPRGPTVAYAKVMRQIIASLQRNLRPLFKELPQLLRQAKTERSRFDVGESRRIRQQIAEALRRVRAEFNNETLERVAERFARSTSTIQRAQLGKQIQAGIGVDVLLTEPRTVALVTDFVSENVSLIKDIPEKIAADLEQTLTRAVTGGRLQKDIAGELQKKFAIGRRRANLIARDQIGKFHGQLNATRQRALGVDKFIWRSVGDDRVRDSHEDFDGQIFEFSNPPDGLPGEPINCRCWAEPVFDGLLGS